MFISRIAFKYNYVLKARRFVYFMQFSLKFGLISFFYFKSRQLIFGLTFWRNVPTFSIAKFFGQKTKYFIKKEALSVLIYTSPNMLLLLDTPSGVMGVTELLKKNSGGYLFALLM